MTTPGAAPLHGMQVLDLSQQLPGPYATYLLATLGAAVTKVEPLGGDAARHLDPEMFAHVNAGKRSVALDLKTPSGQSALHNLVHGHDVVVEGFRPGVTARLACDYATLSAISSRLVYCSLSGVGQAGPLARQATHDISLQAMAGTLTDGPDITRIGVPWVDLATGTSAALAITAAWHAGTGCYLDMSMLDAAIAWSTVKPSALAVPREPTYGTLPTADGSRVVIALLEDAMWTRLCEALHWTDWIDDQRLRRYRDRATHGEEVRDRLAAEIAKRTLDDVVSLAARYDLPIGPVDVQSDPDVREQIAERFPPGAVRGFTPLPNVLLQALAPAPELGADNPPGTAD